MKTGALIPADIFIDQVLASLVRADAAALHQLESAALTVAAPENPAQYPKKRAALAALIDATGRNLRFLHRVANRKAASLPR